MPAKSICATAPTGPAVSAPTMVPSVQNSPVANKTMRLRRCNSEKVDIHLISPAREAQGSRRCIRACHTAHAILTLREQRPKPGLDEVSISRQSSGETTISHHAETRAVY